MGGIGMARLSDRFVAAVLALTVPSIALADTICLPVLDDVGDSITCELNLYPDDPTPIIIDVPPGGEGAELRVVQAVTLSGAPDAAEPRMSTATHWSSARSRRPPPWEFLPPRRSR